MQNIAAFLAVLATICWGMDQVLGKASVRAIHPFFFNVIRSSFAFILILFLFLIFDGNFGKPWIVALAAASGLIGEFLAAELYFMVMKRSPAHIVIPAGNTDPLWGALGAMVLLGEKPGSAILASIILVLIGTFLLAERNGEKDGWRGGIFLALLVAALWGIMLPLAKICLDEGMTQIAYQTVRIGAAAAGCVLFWLVSGMRVGEVGRKPISLTLASGFLAFFLGFVLWLKALSLETASSLAPLLGGKVAFGFLFSVVLLRERTSLKSIAGACLIMAGIFLATL
ncbi:MAG: DMT family transporter [Candidatus Hadarchaeales archaeon]